MMIIALQTVCSLMTVRCKRSMGIAQWLISCLVDLMVRQLNFTLSEDGCLLSLIPVFVIRRCVYIERKTKTLCYKHSSLSVLLHLRRKHSKQIYEL